jgi:hypothetical protein
VLALPVLIGAVLIVGWLLVGPLPRESSVDRNDLVRACGREVLPEYRDIARDIARGMRKDCGIYGPAGD